MLGTRESGPLVRLRLLRCRSGDRDVDGRGKLMGEGQDYGSEGMDEKGPKHISGSCVSRQEQRC